MKIKKAVIPAAGYGTRLLPASKALPKEMLPIVDRPTIQYVIEEAIEAGIEEILVITSKDKESIEDHFDRNLELEMVLEEKGKYEIKKEVDRISNLIDIHFVRQKKQKGLGHAISCAETFVGNDPFAVILGDDLVVSEKPAIGQLMEVYEKKEAPVVGVQDVPKKDVNKYGIVKYEKKEGKSYLLDDMVEKPEVEKAPSNLAILGRYVITPDIFPILENTSKGKGGEIQLTDALKTLADNREVYAHNFSGKRYDVGNKMGFLKATVEFALNRDEFKDEFSSYLKDLVKNI
ncbi:MAG: UTP--glucose-1-phosphate uridylyltransferase GalU [Bacillota bacterium]